MKGFKEAQERYDNMEHPDYYAEEDQEIVVVQRTSFHTCRRDHKDGKVKKGQRYRYTYVRGYFRNKEGAAYGHYVNIYKTILEK